MEKKPKEPKTPLTGFASINEDLVQNILKRTPATSFASAACVSKSWNHNCNQILSKPKLTSAFSLNPDPKVCWAFKKRKKKHRYFMESLKPMALRKGGYGRQLSYKSVIKICFPNSSWPFLLIEIFWLALFMLQLAAKLGSKTPIIVSCTNGIIGRDAVTGEHKEAMLEDFWVDAASKNSGFGMLLTVGYLPGLKVEALPLLRPRKGEEADLKPVMEKLDHAMSRETIIAGSMRSQFLYRRGIESRNIYGRSTKYFTDAVALVFARDEDKPSGEGKIQFHSAISSGVSAIGPRYKAVSVKETQSETGLTTWLTARREGEQEILGGQMIIDSIESELVNKTELFIGVSKQRQCVIGSENPKLLRSLALHQVKGGDGEHLFVSGDGIVSGDYFHFYHSDPKAALSATSNVSKYFRNLKLDWRSCHLHAGDVGSKEVVGGLVFSCWGRGESFFGHSNVDSSPFLDNFPGIPMAGIFGCGEVGRSFTMLNADDHVDQEEKTSCCCLHVYSTVYVLVSYTPAPLKH